jgi:CubicO group peptidase (beta-lactamase class C family)
LSYILEKTYANSFANLLNEKIVKPTGLENTYVFGKINPNNNECKSYHFMGNWIEEKETDFTIALGAGAIISTSSDLTKFADALFAGKLLKSESLENMKTMKDDYGMGLFQIPFYDSKGYGHTGGIDGFSSIYGHFPNEKISYALTSNGSNYENNNISIAVLSAVYGKEYEIPSFSTFQLTSEDLDKYLGTYASSQISLKIKITKNGTTLVAQGTGQPAMPLEATEKDKFKLEKVDAKFEFNPSEKSFVLFQGGGRIKFTKE